MAAKMETSSRPNQNQDDSKKSAKTKMSDTQDINAHVLTATKLFQCTYGSWVPPFIIDIEPLTAKNSTISFRPVHFLRGRSTSWKATMMGYLLFHFGFGCILLKKLFYSEKAEIDVIQVMVILLEMSCASLLYYYSFLLSVDGDILKSANLLIAQGLHHDTAGGKLVGGLLQYYTIGAVFVAPFVPLITEIADIDPFYIFLENTILPSRIYREEIIILLASCVSLILFYMEYMLLVRALGVILIFLGTFLISVKDHLLNLLQSELSEADVLKNYKELFLRFASGRTFLSKFAMAFSLWGQVLLTTGAWFTFNCVGVLPPALIAVSGTVFLGGLGFTLFHLHMAAFAREGSTALLKKQRRKFYRFRRFPKMTSLYLRWRSLQPIPFNCGGEFPLTRQTVIMYLKVLNTNITECVFLVKII